MSINIEISVGELLDKITILEIKSERIVNQEKLKNIKKELKVLKKQWKQSSFLTKEIMGEIKQLKKANEKLWEIEDEIRDKERMKLFDKRFIELARSVYITNDERAELKRTINKKTGSQLIEEKSYNEYN